MGNGSRKVHGVSNANGAFGFFWGEEVRVVASPIGYLIGLTGELRAPTRVDTVAVFRAGGGDNFWHVIDNAQWSFEPIARPGATPVNRTGWAEFAKRCASNVQKILDTKDDGVYAKLYVEDVSRLLMMVGALDRQRDIDTTEAEHAWDTQA